MGDLKVTSPIEYDCFSDTLFLNTITRITIGYSCVEGTLHIRKSKKCTSADTEAKKSDTLKNCEREEREERNQSRA